MYIVTFTAHHCHQQRKMVWTPFFLRLVMPLHYIPHKFTQKAKKYEFHYL